MQQVDIKAVLKICTESVLLTTLIAIVIGVIGYIKQWNSSISYSNAFFMAACLMILAGASSRLGASQEWNYFRLLYAESFREMRSDERANFVMNASSSVRLAALGFLSGVLLILISVFFMNRS